MIVKATRSRRAGQETEARILEAAEVIFARYGFEGARMDQVAEKANVEKANIYYYFKGKDELYRALLDRVINQILTEVTEFLAQPDTGTPFDRMDQFMDLFFRMVERYQGMVALALGELLHPPKRKTGRSPVFKMLEQIETVGAQLIADGIKQGIIREQDPVQALITLEGAIFHYFFLPEERVTNLMGGKKFDPENLEKRKQALREQFRRLLAP